MQRTHTKQSENDREKWLHIPAVWIKTCRKVWEIDSTFASISAKQSSQSTQLVDCYDTVLTIIPIETSKHSNSRFTNVLTQTPNKHAGCCFSNCTFRDENSCSRVNPAPAESWKLRPKMDSHLEQDQSRTKQVQFARLEICCLDVERLLCVQIAWTQASWGGWLVDQHCCDLYPHTTWLVLCCPISFKQ